MKFLKKEKLRFKFKFGVMIEIPSTLFILEELSKLVDFFSLALMILYNLFLQPIEIMPI